MMMMKKNNDDDDEDETDREKAIVRMKNFNNH